MSAHQYSHLKSLLDRMSRAGIISDLKKWEKKDGVCVSYDLNVPESAHILYQKGGNLLELLTYLAAEDSGEYKDCCTGIELDWDDRDLHGASDPFNELDVVMTHGYIPYFVSCKNTQVAKEYLYEIMTMTRHYGGAYAIPVMVSTDVGKDGVRARAKEMGVVLVDTVGEMPAETFSKELKKALQRN